jgi:hypothetical protein
MSCSLRNSLPVIHVLPGETRAASSDNVSPQEATIPPGPGFCIQIPHGQFKRVGDGDLPVPNMIQIVLGKGQIYGMAFEPEKYEYEVKPENIVPLFGSQPFPGLHSGHKVIAAIGQFQPPEDRKTAGRFLILWSAIISVVV